MALVAALVFGAGCWTEGCKRLAYYRGEREHGRARVETIHDTVRRTDVDVDDLTAKPNGFDRFDEEFRNDFTTRYASRGDRWDEYRPAYRFGYDAAADPRWASAKDWNEVEPMIRRDWDARGEGTWDKFKDSVRYAWNRAKQAGNRAADAATGRRV